MTVTDQFKTIDNKIKANHAQYDLDRFAAIISVYSSGDLRKYEYLTGEDLGYKPSVFEQAKFDYSPLGSIFTKGLDKDYKKWLFERLENIKDKIEELQLKIKAVKNKSDFNYDSRYAFYRFYRDVEKFNGMVSLDSKHVKKFLQNFKRLQRSQTHH